MRDPAPERLEEPAARSASPRTSGERCILALASGLGLGYAPVASGTFGTLLGVPLAWALADLPLVAQVPIVASLVLGACWVAGEAERLYGRKDPGRIVIDEVVGYLVGLLGSTATPGRLLLGFLLFRFYDVLKPWPARQLERGMPGGFGVVLDDVAAGVWTFLTLRLVDLVAGRLPG